MAGVMNIVVILVMLFSPCVRAPGKNPEIERLLESVNLKSDGNAKIASVLDDILNLRYQDGLCKFGVQIHPKCVGVHPSNRYGFGVSVTAVHRLGAKIVRMGWSWAACALAICIADGATRKIAKCTTRMQHGSSKFGQCDENEITYGSLANGHTNQFLTAAIDGAETDEESLAVDGHISKEKISMNDHAITEALTKGIRWTALDAGVEDIYGDA